LAEDGADVAICARSDDKDPNPLGTIERTAAEVVAKGRRALPVKLDVMNDGDIEAMVQRVLRELGRIDIVNNAALMGSVAPDFWGGTPAALDAYYRTNLRAPYLLAQLVAPRMAENGGGVIVNITSGGANLPSPPS
jgi:NAD(P)-dependent dehydrogenase (short-subunit alcohol dehydrogenase family)